MEIIIGSHVGMKAPDYYVGAIKEALSYGANTFMIYTGAPQNTVRVDVGVMKNKEGLTLLKEVGIDVTKVIAHAPYIINLGNTVKPETFELAVSFLQAELKRVAAFGIKTVVLHPGAHVGAGVEAGIVQIINGLNTVLEEDNTDVTIALETMAGKGTEIGRTFAELRAIIDGVTKKDRLGVCLDTCHIHDAGYDAKNIEGLLDEFDKVIGLSYLKVIHINDSKNVRGAGKDRHENYGFGEIGFKALQAFVYNPRLEGIPKILETPYIGESAPYKLEIAMIKENVFNPHLKAGLETKSS